MFPQTLPPGRAVGVRLGSDRGHALGGVDRDHRPRKQARPALLEKGRQTFGCVFRREAVVGVPLTFESESTRGIPVGSPQTLEDRFGVGHGEGALGCHLAGEGQPALQQCLVVHTADSQSPVDRLLGREGPSREDQLGCALEADDRVEAG